MQSDNKMQEYAGTPELKQLTYWLSGFKPKLKGVIEIGIATGASTRLWNEFLEKDGIYVGIDINMTFPSIGLYGEVYNVVERYKNDSRMNFLIEDSMKKETVEKAKGIIAARPIDFLYIDGWHSYEAAKSDYELYAPLVDRGGVVAWHDATRNSNVKKAIDEVIDTYEFNAPFLHRCQFDSKSGHCGIVALIKE